MHTNTAHQQG